MRPLLSCRKGEDAGLAITLEASGCLVGRAADCDLSLRDANLSRRHVRFAFTDGAWRVEDLESSNGTWLNDEQLAPHEPKALEHGDVVGLGDDTELAFLDLERLSRTRVMGAAIVTPDGGRLTLHGGDNPIGSAEDCDVIVDDPTIVGHHATLRLTPKGLSVLRNDGPLMVNGEAMDDAELVGGDWVSLSPSLGFSIDILRGFAAPGAHPEPAALSPEAAPPAVPEPAPVVAPAPAPMVTAADDDFVLAAARAADEEVDEISDGQSEDALDEQFDDEPPDEAEEEAEDIFSTGELPEGIGVEPFADADFGAAQPARVAAAEVVSEALAPPPPAADVQAAASTQRVSLDSVAAALARGRSGSARHEHEDAEATHSQGSGPWPAEEARTQRFSARPLVDPGDATHLSTDVEEAITLGPGHMIDADTTTLLSESPIVGKPKPPPRRLDSTETETLGSDVIDAALAKAKARHDQLALQAKPSTNPSLPPRDLPRPPSSPRGAVRREVAARLHVTYGEAEVATVLLREGRHLVGKSARCRVKLDHVSVVDEHAEVSVGPDGLRIRALSPSGILSRQGRRFADATMPPGDRFEVGELTAWFENL